MATNLDFEAVKIINNIEKTSKWRNNCKRKHKNLINKHIVSSLLTYDKDLTCVINQTWYVLGNW